MKSKRVVIFIDWFSPAYKAGGPIKSVTNIINALSDEFKFDVVTSDRDMGDQSAYRDIQLNRWIDRGRYRIIYLEPQNRIRRIRRILESEQYARAYFNSAFSKDFTILPLRVINNSKLSIRPIVAPRGMFGKGALAIKPLKKKVFLVLAKSNGLYKNVLWHATNQIEQNNIYDIFGASIQCLVAGNISANKVVRSKIIKQENSLKLVFFSRISSKKNLAYILDLLSSLNLKKLELDIYGPIEDESYWQGCTRMIGNLNLPISYKGVVSPSDVQSTLSNYHFFILPTLHENFGHVIVEAIVSGCGLIISDQTPWSHLEDKGVGWDTPIVNKPKWLAILSDCYQMSQNEYDDFRTRVYDFAKVVTDDKIEIQETRKLFE